MRRWVSIKRAATGATAVTVTLVDGDISARWTTKTYLGNVSDAVATSEGYALRALEEIRVGLEPAMGQAS